MEYNFAGLGAEKKLAWSGALGGMRAWERQACWGHRIGTVERGSGDVSAHDGEGACERSLRNGFRVWRTDAAGPGRGGNGTMQHWVCTGVGWGNQEDTMR